MSHKTKRKDTEHTRAQSDIISAQASHYLCVSVSRSDLMADEKSSFETAAENAAKQFVESAKDATSNAVEAAKDVVTDAKESVENAAEKAVDAAKGAVAGAAKALGGGASKPLGGGASKPLGGGASKPVPGAGAAKPAASEVAAKPTIPVASAAKPVVNTGAAKPASVAAPVAAPKAAAPVAKKEEEAPPVATTGVTRREFLNYVWTASMALFLAQLGGLSYIFAFPRFRPGQFGGKIEVDISNFPELNKAPIPNNVGKFWLVNTDEGVNVLYKICTHLGCIYPWSDAQNKFACPCHGSQFQLTGKYIAGPAPRDLDKFEFEIVDGGGNVLKTVSDGLAVPLPSGAAKVRVNTGRKIEGKSHF
jgi:cytochrome b6-f complex iron-sulfur subunit